MHIQDTIQCLHKFLFCSCQHLVPKSSSWSQESTQPGSSFCPPPGSHPGSRITRLWFLPSGDGSVYFLKLLGVAQPSPKNQGSTSITAQPWSKFSVHSRCMQSKIHSHIQNWRHGNKHKHKFQNGCTLKHKGSSLLHLSSAVFCLKTSLEIVLAKNLMSCPGFHCSLFYLTHSCTSPCVFGYRSKIFWGSKIVFLKRWCLPWLSDLGIILIKIRKNCPTIIKIFCSDNVIQ